MTGITPFLWFDDQAEQAVNFSVSLFPNSRVLKTTRAGDKMQAMRGMKKIDIAGLYKAHAGA